MSSSGNLNFPSTSSYWKNCNKYNQYARITLWNVLWALPNFLIVWMKLKPPEIIWVLNKFCRTEICLTNFFVPWILLSNSSSNGSNAVFRNLNKFVTNFYYFFGCFHVIIGLVLEAYTERGATGGPQPLLLDICRPYRSESCPPSPENNMGSSYEAKKACLIKLHTAYRGRGQKNLMGLFFIFARNNFYSYVNEAKNIQVGKCFFRASHQIFAPSLTEILNTLLF